MVRTETGRLTTLTSPILSKQTTSIQSIKRQILTQLINSSRSTALPRRPIVLVTSSLAPSSATNLSPRGVLNFYATTKKTASRATVVTQSLGVPTITKTNPRLLSLSTNSVTVLSNSRNALCPHPARTSLRGTHRTRTRHTRLHSIRRRAHFRPTLAASNRHVRIITGVNDPSRTTRTIRTKNRKINLLEARFLFLGHDTPPARRRRCRTLQRVARTLGNLPLVIHALSVKNSGRIPCLGRPTRRGPFLNVHKIQLYLRHASLFRARLQTVLQTTRNNCVQIVFPVVTALRSVHTTGAILRSIQTTIGNPPMRINVVIRIPDTILVTTRFTRRISFFSINAGSLARCLLTVSQNRPALTGRTSTLRPTILQTVRRAIRNTTTTNG